MLVRLEQSEKATSPISVTDGGMEMLVRLEQPQKAPSPISVTDGGMEMLVRLEQPKKGLPTIFVTDLIFVHIFQCQFCSPAHSLQPFPSAF